MIKVVDEKKIPIKVINKSDNHLPEYKKLGDSGMDVRASEDKVVWRYKTEIVHTGLYVEIPDGYEIQVRSRSGLAANHGIFVLNSPGTLDSSYRGELMVILHNTSGKNFTIEEGDRIAQLVLQKVPKIKWIETDVLSETDRGEGGIGHSGVK